MHSERSQIALVAAQNFSAFTMIYARAMMLRGMDGRGERNVASITCQNPIGDAPFVAPSSRTATDTLTSS